MPHRLFRSGTGSTATKGEFPLSDTGLDRSGVPRAVPVDFGIFVNQLIKPGFKATGMILATRARAYSRAESTRCPATLPG